MKEIIADYKKYGFDKERGSLLIVIGKILNELEKWKKYSWGRLICNWVEFILNRISLGWLFIAFPKK